jgi:hypothetical protein
VRGREKAGAKFTVVAHLALRERRHSKRKMNEFG